MIHDLLTHWRSIPGLTAHPVWSASFQWLEREASAAAEGDHPLGSTGFLARVMSYPLKARGAARYESHRRTIDVQYTLEGGEGIEFSDPSILTSLNDYNETKEVEHYATPSEGQALVANLAGRFTLILPGEPHMPQLSVSGCTQVKKVVIKIPAALVGL
ncbi:MAG: YhcH/YjgK/YiaL family protein [Verrucomicrobiae bacterium]|nr:YhcH/YjgK/YiaL family protein [Verrucomicrobiae bacterium]